MTINVAYIDTDLPAIQAARGNSASILVLQPFGGGISIGKKNTPSATVDIAGDLVVENVPEFDDNASAIAANLPIGKLYRTGDVLKIVH